MKAFTYIFNLIMVVIVVAGTMYGCEKSIERRERYEIEHNCKYDYNDLCYTIDERPWLFK